MYKSKSLFRATLFLLPLWLIGAANAVGNNSNFTCRKDTHTFVPASYEFKNNKISVDAPIGDNVLLSPIVKIKINGQGPFIFLFDTGFSRTMISNELAQKLNLRKHDTESVRTRTPAQVVQTFQHIYLIDKIEIGGLTIKNYGVASSSGFEDDIQDLKRMKVDGVLSANAFYGLLLTLDYQNEKIHLEEGSLLPEQKGVIDYADASDVPLINAEIKFDKLNKVVAQDFIIDTGFPSYFFVNACHIPEMLKFTGRENLIAYDYLGSEQKKYFAQLYGNIILSKDYSIQSPYITFGPVNCQLKKPVGLVGRTFFEKYKVTIDQVNSLIKLQKY
jgi:predicted aspartyl protease